MNYDKLELDNYITGHYGEDQFMPLALYPLKELYLDWFNNYISIDGIADEYGVHPKRIIRLINKGRILHNDKFGLH